MIKIVYCITRRPHLTREQFQEYWLNHHGKAIWERATSIGMIKYAQNHTIDSALGAACAASRGGAEPYDGASLTKWRWPPLEATAAHATAIICEVQSNNRQEVGRASCMAFVLAVTDLELSAAYYRDVLGFRISWEDGTDWRASRA